ncbi:MAG: UDP-N-acetylmuramoyl-tripeptide--D-alanyl-D-alanine ligase [Candidatus Omnitrophica bacterium]|nr:UDP-N-acetylmuramoyl-tripeptide--D-alanyl-D-alanine ligase [Candidatus Omnitrophota bacterium]
MKVSDIVTATGGRLLSGDPAAGVDASKISTDSRGIKKGSLFIALNGPNFDGNDFAREALRRGACGAIVLRGRGKPIAAGRKVVIEVGDTTKALQDIARFHRMKFDIPVIAVTGSNGKTTTKEMIWEVLSRRYKVLKNEGTKNNHIGVPQTLLKLTARHEMCVLELGTNHAGEIRALAGIARPTMAVITNVGHSHLEFLRDLVGVFREKRSLVTSLGRWSKIVLNGDDPFLARIKDSRYVTILCGFKKSNDYAAGGVSARGERLRFDVNGAKGFELRLLGRHNIYNALAAVAVGAQFGVSYGAARKALKSYAPANRRLNLVEVGGLSVIDDCYNSNPLSMKSALEALAAYPARMRWVVSADMLELGRKSAHLHRAIGADIARSPASGMITFGTLSRHTLAEARARGMQKDRSWHCLTHDGVAAILKRVAKKGDAVLIKGSRAMRMEEVIKKLGVGS